MTAETSGCVLYWAKAPYTFLPDSEYDSTNAVNNSKKQFYVLSTTLLSSVTLKTYNKYVVFKITKATKRSVLFEFALFFWRLIKDCYREISSLQATVKATLLLQSKRSHMR